jgi:hypothetical protein
LDARWRRPVPSFLPDPITSGLAGHLGRPPRLLVAAKSRRGRPQDHVHVDVSQRAWSAATVESLVQLNVSGAAWTSLMVWL